MPGDPKAEQLVQQNNIIGLFQYLGPMWLLVCMEILEDMVIKGKFYPNPDRYRGELASAGINIPRMEVAMAAAMHKVGRTITWEKFEEMYGPKMAGLPPQQQGEVKNFWFNKPVPGLSQKARTATEGDYWYSSDTWEFEFEADLEVGSYRLPNGTVIPLPPRGKYWPKRTTTAKFIRSKSRLGKIRYDVLLAPTGWDAYWFTKWATDQVAESLLSKSACILIGGTIAPILAGAATVLIPNEEAETFAWKTTCSEGNTKDIPVTGITSGFNK